MSVEVITFGCRLNSNESQAMKRSPEATGLKDIIIVTGRAAETRSGGIGRTEDFTLVKLKADLPPGAIIAMTMAGHDGRRLLAAWEK